MSISQHHPDPAPLAPARLLLVRHGETTHNLEARLSGWAESDLSPYGRSQVVLLTEHFILAHGDVAAIYVSPSNRARQTAEQICAQLGHEAIHLDDLREMFFGELDGLPFEELRAAYAHLLQQDEDAEIEDFMWPGGESRNGFTARVSGVVNQIAGVHQGQTVGVVTHGGVIATILCLMHGESTANWRKWVVSNASLTEINWDPRTRTGSLIRHGDEAHLASLITIPEPIEEAS